MYASLYISSAIFTHWHPLFLFSLPPPPPSLSQAEALADLLAAETEAQRRQALTHAVAARTLPRRPASAAPPVGSGKGPPVGTGKGPPIGSVKGPLIDGSELELEARTPGAVALSSALGRWRAALLRASAAVEASLDFSDELDGGADALSPGERRNAFSSSPDKMLPLFSCVPAFNSPSPPPLSPETRSHFSYLPFSPLPSVSRLDAPH